MVRLADTGSPAEIHSIIVAIEMLSYERCKCNSRGKRRQYLTELTNRYMELYYKLAGAYPDKANKAGYAGFPLKNSLDKVLLTILQDRDNPFNGTTLRSMVSNKELLKTIL